MVHQLAGQFDADDARAEHEHVHIVMLDALTGRITVMAYRRANPWDLVGRYRRADATAADQHTSFCLAGHECLAHRFGEVRIIDRRGAVRAFVDNLVAALTQIDRETLL